MDAEKVLEVISIYRNYFENLGVEKADYPHQYFIDEAPIEGEELCILSHCHGMLDNMEGFVAEGRMEKVFRWLGFIQGCVWSTSHYTLEDLKNHNRPDNNNTGK